MKCHFIVELHKMTVYFLRSIRYFQAISSKSELRTVYFRVPYFNETVRFDPNILFDNQDHSKLGAYLENFPGSNKFVRELDSHGKKFSNF